jgi:hypothetical protein
MTMNEFDNEEMQLAGRRTVIGGLTTVRRGYWQLTTPVLTESQCYKWTTPPQWG